VENDVRKTQRVGRIARRETEILFVQPGTDQRKQLGVSPYLKFKIPDFRENVTNTL